MQKRSKEGTVRARPCRASFLVIKTFTFQNCLSKPDCVYPTAEAAHVRCLSQDSNNLLQVIRSAFCGSKNMGFSSMQQIFQIKHIWYKLCFLQQRTVALRARAFNVQFYTQCAVLKILCAVLARDLRRLHCISIQKRDSG